MSDVLDVNLDSALQEEPRLIDCLPEDSLYYREQLSDLNMEPSPDTICSLQIQQYSSNDTSNIPESIKNAILARNSGDLPPEQITSFGVKYKLIHGGLLGGSPDHTSGSMRVRYQALPGVNALATTLVPRASYKQRRTWLSRSNNQNLNAGFFGSNVTIWVARNTFTPLTSGR